MYALRSIEEHLDMTYHDQHEPAECYAGVHVAEKFVSFPKLDVEKTVAEPILYVLEHNLGIDERKEEFLSVCT